MKQNDWIVATLNNPDLSVSDFKAVGMDLLNTQLRSKEDYEKSPYIQLLFQKDGSFDKSTFEKFYDQEAARFDQFLESDSSNLFMYDLFDTDRVIGSNVKNPNFKLYTVANPTRQSYGIVGRDDLGTLTLSVSELALTLKIYDPSTDTWSKNTVNDLALFKNPIAWAKSLFLDPLVIAKWDEDGVHTDPFTGLEVVHKKGEYKTNKEGTYYTEKLNGRSLIGQDVISAFDTLTVDGEGINKYDFFDSDGLDKSVAGTIAKSAATILPMFITGPVADIYAGVMVAKETMKTLPMITNMIGAWFNAEDSKMMNTLAGIGSKFSLGQSLYANENLLTVEGLSTLMTDVALLWGQQKAIAKAVANLLGGKNTVLDAYKDAYMTYQLNKVLLDAKLAEKAITKEEYLKTIGNPDNWEDSAIGRAAIKKFVKPAEEIARKQSNLGSDISLAYMALVSNTDVYDSMILHGASKKEAAAVALGSTLGMFGVDKYAHLGELFFDDLTADSERACRATFKKEADKWGPKFLEEAFLATEKEDKLLALKRLVQKGISFGKNTTNKFWDDLLFHSTKFLGKAIGEGIEEVAEELVSDSAKSIYELAGDLGFDTSVKDVGAWENALERYGMNFLGGAMGGVLFSAVDVWNNGFHNNNIKDDLIYLIQNNKTDTVLDELNKAYRKGKLGNTNLSTKTTTIIDDEGNSKKVFLTAQNGDETLNDFVYNKIKDTVLLLDAIINGNLLGLTDEQLFLQMVLGELRVQELNNLLKDQLKGLSYTEGYLLLFHDLAKEYVSVVKELEAADNTLTGLPGDTQLAATDEKLRHMTDAQKAIKLLNMAKLELRKIELEKERDEFLLGKKSFPFIEKMLFGINSMISGDFYYVNFEEYCKKEYKKLPNELSESEYINAVEKYRDYKKNNLPKDLDVKFLLFKEGLKATSKWFLEMLLNLKTYKKSTSLLFLIDKLIAEEFKLYSINSVLDFQGETEESDSYINRDNPMDDEEDIDFISRKSKRIDDVEKENIRLKENLKNKIFELIDALGGFIDSSVLRFISRRTSLRDKDARAKINSKYNHLLQSVDLNVYNDFDSSGSGYSTLYNVIRNNIPKLLKLIVLNFPNLTKDNYEEYLNNLFNDFFNTILGDLVDNALYRSEGSLYLDPRSTLNAIDTLYNLIYNKGLELGIELKRDDILNEIFNSGVLENLDSIITGLKFNINSDGSITIERSNEANPAYMSQLKDKYLNNKLSDYLGDVSDAHNEESQADSIDIVLDNIRAHVNDYIKEYFNDIDKDPIIDLYKGLKSRIRNIDTPIKNILKALAIKFGKNPQSIESILDKMYERFMEEESLDDFLIEEPEKQAFEEFSDILKFANALIASATNGISAIDLFSYNQSLNQIAKNHNIENFEELAELDLDVANSLRRDLYLINQEIGEINNGEASPLSWRWYAALNEANKVKLFLRAEKAWNTCLIEFINNSSLLRKLKIDDKEYDLFQGIDTLDKEPTETNINKIFDLIYDNFLNLLKVTGLSALNIFAKTKLLDTFLLPGEHVVLITNPINENVNYNDLTFYDKVQIFLTIVGLRSSDFSYYMIHRIADEDLIAPLTVLSWITRLAIASIEGQEYINAAYKYIQLMQQDLDLSTQYNLPIDENGVIVLGNGGAGKSRVIAKNVAEWQCKDVDKTNIKEKTRRVWLSSFALSQIDNLKDSVSYGTTMFLDGEDSLYAKMADLAKLKEMLEDIKNSNRSSKYYSKLDTNEDTNETILVNFNELDIKTLAKEDCPKEIIIDECTHVPLSIIQVLAEFCRRNGIHYTLLGDRKLLGFHKDLDLSILKECCFAFRTLELGITLRDTNALHAYNVNALGNIISQYLNSELGINGMSRDLLLAILKSLHFRVYTKEINGDLLTTSLTLENVDAIPKETFDPRKKESKQTTVGYIGLVTDNYVKMLKARGLDVTVYENEEDILGREYDYCIYNKTLSSDPYKAMKLLYTAITRGKEGSIIISSNVFDIVGKNKIDTYKAKASTVLGAVLRFREDKTAEYEQMLKGYSPTYLTKTKAQPNKNLPETELPETELPETELPETELPEAEGPIDITNDGEYQLPYNYNYEDSPRFLLVDTADNGDKILVFGTKVNDEFIPCDVDSAIPIDPEYTSGENAKVWKMIYSKEKLLTLICKKKGENISYPCNENPFEDIFNLDLLPLKLKKSYLTPMLLVNLFESKPEMENPKTPKLLLLGINKYNNDLELPLAQTTFPIMIHSSVSFLDLDTTDERAWIPTNTGDVVRNANIFITDDLLTDGKITLTDSDIENQKLSALRILQLRLLSFKRKFTYSTPYKNVPNFIKDIIDLATYEALQEGNNSSDYGYKLVVRKSNDLFVRNTGYKKIKPIAGDYIIECVLYFKDKSGKRCEVTMGLLGDPVTYANNLDKMKANYTADIKKLQKSLETAITLGETKKQESLLKQIDKLQELITHYDSSNSESSYAVLYSNWVQLLKQEADAYYENSDRPTENYEITNIPKIKWTYLTRTRNKEGRNKLKPVRIISFYRYKLKFLEALREALKEKIGQDSSKHKILQSKLNSLNELISETLDYIRNNFDESFASRNVYTTWSNPYVITDTSYLGIDDSVKGKHSVIFVSNDDTIPRDRLVYEYLKLKNHQLYMIEENGFYDPYLDEESNSVRMLVLNNAGISLLDLVNFNMRLVLITTLNINGTVVRNIAPWNTAYTGKRMYAAMWNYRANLLNFLNKLNTWITENPDIDLEKLALYDRIRNKSINNALTEDEIAIQNEPDYKDYIDKLDTFNLSLTHTCKEFRLGYTYDEKNKNGLFISKLDHFDDSFYDKDKGLVMGVYIEPEMVNRQVLMLESVFTYMLDPLITCQLDKTELVTHLEGYANSLTGDSELLKPHIKGDSIITIKENSKLGEEELFLLRLNSDYNDGNPILHSNDLLKNKNGESLGMLNVFANLPIIVVKLIELSKAFKLAADDNSWEWLSRSKNDIIIDNYDASGKSSPITLERINCLLDIFTYNASDNDESFENMFRLLFHGTVEENIFDAKYKDSCAMFPNGFYVDPLTSTTTLDPELLNKGLKLVDTGLAFMETDCCIDDPIGFIGLEDIKEIKKLEEDKVLLEAEVINLPIPEIITSEKELEDVINSYLEGLNNTNKELKFEELKSYLQSQIVSLDDIVNNTTIENCLVDYTINDKVIQLLTLYELLSEKILETKKDIDITNIKYCIDENNNIVGKVNDIIFEIKVLDNKIENVIVIDPNLHLKLQNKDSKIGLAETVNEKIEVDPILINYLNTAENIKSILEKFSNLKNPEYAIYEGYIMETINKITNLLNLKNNIQDNLQKIAQDTTFKDSLGNEISSKLLDIKSYMLDADLENIENSETELDDEIILDLKNAISNFNELTKNLTDTVNIVCNIQI